MTTVHVTCGLPASGKTSHARSLDVLRFSLDDFRAMCGNGKESWTAERELVVIDAMIESARTAIVAGHDVVLDNTHLVPRLPRMYRKAFSPLGVTFKVHSFTDVPITECIERDAARENGVGEDAIRTLNDRLVGASKNGWKLTDKWMNSTPYAVPVPYVVPDNADNLPEVVIVDIDGTVALHGDERGHYDYSKVLGDAPNWPIINLVHDLDDIHEIIFLSGRQDSCRDDTIAWLADVGFKGHKLFMRATDDMRPDYIIKMELFDTHIRGKYDVRFVLDDRDQVVRCWRAMGLTCLQVADGKF